MRVPNRHKMGQILIIPFSQGNFQNWTVFLKIKTISSQTDLFVKFAWAPNSEKYVWVWAFLPVVM